MSSLESTALLFDYMAVPAGNTITYLSQQDYIIIITNHPISIGLNLKLLLHTGTFLSLEYLISTLNFEK